MLLWPEEARTFHNGKGIIAALVTTNFDTPREGSIELLLNGNNAANFTPEAQDGEGNRRLHVVLPDLSDGQFSVEIRCTGVDGSLLERHGATFSVDSTAPSKSSSVGSLEQATLCHPVGFCDSDAECNGHGTCSQGACLCHGDWAGETCEHDIYHNPSFLPDSNPARSPSLCHRSAVWEEGAKRVHEQLLQMHALHHCVVRALARPNTAQICLLAPLRERALRWSLSLSLALSLSPSLSLSLSLSSLFHMPGVRL